MVNVSDADAEMYFADRQAHGFNTVWINLLCTTYTGGRPDGSTFDGVVPFTDTIPFTSSYDLGTPNEAYFAHVDRILRLAEGHGLQVLLDPIETGGWLETMLVNGATRCRDYGRYLGNRYKDFDNILWMSGNDFPSWAFPPHDAVVLAVARGILDVEKRHLHTLELNPPTSSSLDDVNWTRLIGLNATYTYLATYALLLQDYARADFRPNFMVEAYYEFEGAGPLILRKQEYWAMTSGATGQLYGNHYTWPFRSGWQDNLDTPGSDQMSHLIRLFAPRAWYALVPDTTHVVLTDGYGTYSSSETTAHSDYATAARTPQGNLVIVYTPVLRTLTIDMSMLGAAAVAHWYDPSSGAYVPIVGSPLPNTGSRSFTPPGENHDRDGDWVLILETTPVGGGPGAVPDGGTVAGTPLIVSQGPFDTLHLTWGVSCSGAANDYEVYEGTLPIAGTYNHVPLNCSVGNVTTANITPAAGDTYYLVVPVTSSSEGSYGKSFIGGGEQEIPQGAGACHPQQLSACP
jgi:hypothetical protein